MAGILKLHKHRRFDEVVTGVSGKNIQVSMEVPERSIVTSLILYDGDIVDYSTTEGYVSGGVTLDFVVSDNYNPQKVGIFSFSAPDGYSNRFIGSDYWAVWFHNLSEVLLVGGNYYFSGAVLLAVPWTPGEMRMVFNRLGNSQAGHGEIT